jgi:hypothetical protein
MQVISIGEIVTAALVSGDSSTRSTLDEYLLVGIISALAVIIKLSYFDLAVHPSVSGAQKSNRVHALNHSVYTGCSWAFLHVKCVYFHNIIAI